MYFLCVLNCADDLLQTVQQNRENFFAFMLLTRGHNSTWLVIIPLKSPLVILWEPLVNIDIKVMSNLHLNELNGRDVYVFR